MRKPLETFIDLHSFQGFNTFGTLENWFFAAPYGNELMRAWKDEFKHSWEIGPDEWINQNVWHRGWAHDADWHYLNQHACFRKVLDDRCAHAATQRRRPPFASASASCGPHARYMRSCAAPA